jgi:hypothetical protein
MLPTALPTAPRTASSALALAALASASTAQATIHDTTGSAAASWGQVTDVVGDTNFDGYAEVMVGAWRHDPPGLPDAGAVFVYDGASGLLALTIPGTGANDHMGYGSSRAGDVNGDGIADVCAAADEDDTAAGANAGSAAIVSGADGSTIWSWSGESAGDLFGWSTAFAGDVDADGTPDVVIGALLAENASSPSNAGSLTVYSGATGLPLHQIHGDATSGNLGSNVGHAGDLNADGRADVLGVQKARVRAFSGLDASVLHDLTVAGGGTIGLKVSGGVDCNGDGSDDLVVGASGFTSNTGRVTVFSGANGAVLHTFDGDLVGDQLGAGVAGAGDLDGDGYGDVVAGSPGSDGGGSSSGALRAWSGRTGAKLFTISGNAPNQQIGKDAGAGADIDLDGFPDAIGCSTNGYAKSVSFTPQGLAPFGTGTPGCAGAQPLSANAVPTLGDAAFALHSAHAPPFLPAFLVLGDTAGPAGVPVLGALLHVLPPPSGSLFLLFGTPAADALGSLVAPLPIPPDATLAGATFATQIGTAWAAGPCAGTFSSSRGLALTIQ